MLFVHLGSLQVLRSTDSLSTICFSTLEARSCLESRAQELREAAGIIDGQLAFKKRSAIWVRSLARLGTGNDVAKMVADVRHKEKSCRIRKSTWGIGNREEKRYSENTMGYQVRHQ